MSPSSDFLSLVVFLPPLWTVLLLAVQGVRAVQRRWRGGIRLEEDKDPQKPLFSVFVEDSDILAAAGVDADVTESSEGTTDVGEAVLPPPPLAVVLVPLVESLGWAALAFHRLRREASFMDVLAVTGRAGTWLYAFLFQLSRRTATAPLALLSLYVVLLGEALVSLALQARSVEGDPFLSALFLDRLADALLNSYLIAAILHMPLNAPLGIAIKLAEGGSSDFRTPSPEDSNSVLGAFTYSWMNGIMRVAHSRPVQKSDVWALAMSNRAEVLSRRFNQLRSKTLTRKLLRASARDISIDASLKLIASTSEYLRPFFIQKILENLTLYHSSLSSPASSPTTSLASSPSAPPAVQPWTPIEKAYLWTFSAFASMLLKTLAQQRHFHYARRIGMRLRSEVTVAVFEKALKRQEVAGVEEKKGDEDGNQEDGSVEEGGKKESASVGKVVSMISDDVNRILRMGCDSHLIYGAPLEIALGLFFLYNLMGWSALFGFLILAVSAPLNYWVGKQAVKISRNRSIARDARTTSLQELLVNIRSIKLFGWSNGWVDRVEVKRSEELRWAVRDWIVRWLTTALWSFISLIVPLTSFFAYVKLAGHELTVAVAFTALSLFSLIRGPLNEIPGFSIRILQLRVSIARLESFFAEDEIASHAEPPQRQAAKHLAMKEATLRCAGAEEGKMALREVSLEFPEGGLTVVSGPTGSGKSSLLLGLLGELEVVSGTVELPASISYAAQHPWLESLTVRDNILFGYAFDRNRYNAVTKACALDPDLAILSGGDLTFVGERGVSLSGGQKARLALARAIYAPTSHLLLDDIFSAVDSHTARHLLDHLFAPSNRSSLLRGRTVVLVTHHVDLVLPYTEWHVELEDGRVKKQGKVEKGGKAEEKVEDELERMEEHEQLETAETGIDGQTAEQRTGQVGHIEGWVAGEVSGAMYKTYLSSSGYLTWLLIGICLLARPALSFSEQFWLRRWGEAAESGEVVDSTYFLLGYLAIGSATSVDTLLATTFIYIASLRGSRSLFHRLLVRVVRSPLRWFDVVPLGTIQNRLTNDVGTLDEALATNFSEFAGNVISMAASLIVVSIVLPTALISSIFFAATYYYIFRSYLVVNRDVNRIAATTASPLFSSFAEALRGVTTIRAFGKQREYRARLCEIIDDTLAFWYLGATLDVWLSIRTQLLSAFCLLATATFATYTRISPGLAGIAITSSQSVIMALNYLCGAYGRLVLSMNSLERITEYLEVPQEPEGKVPPAAWPSARKGQELIQFQDVVMRYSLELPPVLHSVSFTIKAGERVGIVGRTGSGKSTLATSLLRFTDPTSGSIAIDKLDISTLSLTHLRQSVTLVPQEPLLVSGTLRENLDPLHEHSDEECLSVLKRIHLQPPASSGSSTPSPSTPDTDERALLDLPVSANGTNWSSGERQLIALARALLRNSRIVILDESSASLDHSLDARLQQVLRDELPPDAAVLIIAHRLQTVLYSDRLLVLDTGRIVEYDTPQVLLARQNGVFRTMWEKSGGGKVEE
ncbi:hypothetical protein JCM8547_008286 [Rhodosporidiobolus lusitaniae]